MLELQTFTQEELSDMEDAFSEEHRSELDRFEDSLISLFKSERYRDFLDLFENAKQFCLSFGPGGCEYFKNELEDDPRIDRAKKNLELQEKYSDLVSLEDVSQEILLFVRENERAFASELFKRFSVFPRDLVQKAITKLCKEKAIVKGYDESGYKIYIAS